MEALQHSHLMHNPVIISGDDEMMDSDYDQAVQQDDDYDIELDGGEVYSNAGDEEMKFDMGEEAITYDNDDLMLDEGEYQTTMAHEEMIITEVQPVNAPFSSIEMSTATTAEIDHSHITQPESHLDSSADLPDTQPLSQASTQDINTDPFVLSQHVPGIVIEVPKSPPVQQVQEVQQDVTEVAENTQQELHVEAEEDVIHSSIDNQPEQPYTEFKPSDAGGPGQAGQDGDTSVEPSAQSESVLTLEKIHPIIVQFESNTLALFNSEHYLNFSALDSSQSTYPEVPSVFLLQDISFYAKGFDELFGALREMFGATIGDDAEITMEFESLELFLHEDNLLSKSISLSDLMDLHIRLSKQDGIERPDPLYIVLSTQARFTKRYSELLTAAGEGKGLSQVCTYSPTNQLPAANDLPRSPEEQAHAVEVDDVKSNEAKSPLGTFTEVEKTGLDVHKGEEVSTSKYSGPNELASPTEEREGEKDIVEAQALVKEAGQEYDDVRQTAAEGENGEDEEELLPAEDEEEQGNHDASPADQNIQQQNVAERLAENITNQEPSGKNVDPTSATVEEVYVEEVEESEAVVTEAQQPEEVYEPETEQYFEEEEDVEVEEVAEAQEVVEQQKDLGAKDAAKDLFSPIEKTPEAQNASKHENSRQKEFPPGEEVPVEETGEYVEREERYGDEQVAPVIIDTVYNPRSQSFNAEELLDYEEEEEESSPLPEIPNEVEHTAAIAHDSNHDVKDEREEGESPETALASPHDEGVSAHPDDDSFSSATVVGAGEAHSPGDYGTSPNSGTAQTQSPHETDTEQHHIEYAEDETSADIDNAEAPEGEEVEDLGTYVVQEYEYQDETWQGDETGDFLQEESYYTAVADQEEYVDNEYDEQDPSTALAQGEETTEGSTGENYEENGDENVDYPDGEGFDDDGAYEEYPEEEEVTEFEAFHGARSPSGKRHREEESDALDVQDIKRTRST